MKVDLEEAFPAELKERFRPVKTLGAGGMGVVFEARDRNLDRRVAIKLLHLGQEEEHQIRFQREAKWMAECVHPHVVRAYDFGILGDGSAYLVLEFVEGESLEHLSMKDFGETPREALECFQENLIGVAEALDLIHQAGIIHRDIKVQNLIWDRSQSRLVIADFGLAYREDADALTKTGYMVGTLGYLSPQALRQKEPDPSDDWWALGVTLFLFLERDLPYRQTQLHGLAAGVEVAPKEAKILPKIPPYERLVRGLLTLDPETRTRGAVEVRRLLEGDGSEAVLILPEADASGRFPARLQSTQVAPATQDRRVNRWRRRVVGAVLVCLGMGIGFWGQFGRDPVPDPGGLLPPPSEAPPIDPPSPSSGERFARSARQLLKEVQSRIDQGEAAIPDFWVSAFRSQKMAPDWKRVLTTWEPWTKLEEDERASLAKVQGLYVDAHLPVFFEACLTVPPQAPQSIVPVRYRHRNGNYFEAKIEASGSWRRALLGMTELEIKIEREFEELQKQGNKGSMLAGLDWAKGFVGDYSAELRARIYSFLSTPEAYPRLISQWAALDTQELGLFRDILESARGSQNEDKAEIWNRLAMVYEFYQGHPQLWQGSLLRAPLRDWLPSGDSETVGYAWAQILGSRFFVASRAFPEVSEEEDYLQLAMKLLERDSQSPPKGQRGRVRRGVLRDLLLALSERKRSEEFSDLALREWDWIRRLPRSHGGGFLILHIVKAIPDAPRTPARLQFLKAVEDAVRQDGRRKGKKQRMGPHNRSQILRHIQWARERWEKGAGKPREP